MPRLQRSTRLQCAASAQSGSTPQLLSRAGRPRVGLANGVGRSSSIRVPVSYTHLTLPTICSV
eukprot:11354527-Alexandrium_andersonii.AAC.1